MSADSKLLKAYQDGYINLVEACIQILEKTPSALDKSSVQYEAALNALVGLAGSLEASRDLIREALAES